MKRNFLMDNLKKVGGIIVCCLLSIFAFAQDNVKMDDNNDFMRSEGKIYVVVAVIVVIMAGLFAYLINIERKIKKLEKETEK